MKRFSQLSHSTGREFDKSNDCIEWAHGFIIIQKPIKAEIVKIIDLYELEDTKRDLSELSYNKEESYRFTSTSKQQLMEHLASLIQKGEIFPIKEMQDELESFEYL